MTQQEFVKKESNKIELSRSWYYCKGAFAEGNSIGLLNGLGIAMRFAEWVNDNFVSVVGHDGCWQTIDCIIFNETDIKRYSTDELLTIFLTEKYGQ